jgi:phage gpG-like protein
MLRLNVTITGQEGLERGIRSKAERAGDLRPAFRRIAEEFRIREARLFRSEGASGAHGAWPRLSPRYADWKAKRAPGAGILVLRGDLRTSLTVAGAEGAIEEVTPHSLTLGTSLPHAGAHQRGRGRLPVRRVIDPTKADVERYAKIVREHLKGGG